MAAALAQPRRSIGRLLLEAIGFAVLAYFLYVGGDLLWKAISGELSEAERIEVTVAPGVSVEALPTARSLAKARFAAFDAAPNGAIVVSVGSRLFDMANGDDVFAGQVPVQSFAFVGEALAVIDDSGRLGAYDDGRLQVLGEPPMIGARLVAASDRSRLFFLRKEYDGEANSPALVVMGEGMAPETLAGSFDPVGAVGGDAIQTYYSVGGALFQAIDRANSTLTLVLPDPQDTITGIAVAGGAVYFATKRAIYTLEEGIALPLVIGLGGDLRFLPDGLYVLSAANGRLYRLVVARAAKP